MYSPYWLGSRLGLSVVFSSVVLMPLLLNSADGWLTLTLASKLTPQLAERAVKISTLRLLTSLRASCQATTTLPFDWSTCRKGWNWVRPASPSSLTLTGANQVAPLFVERVTQTSVSATVPEAKSPKVA